MDLPKRAFIRPIFQDRFVGYGVMNKSTRYSRETRERAVRMVFEHQAEYDWSKVNWAPAAPMVLAPLSVARLKWPQASN